jgi:Rrf2 family protein
MFVTRKIDYGLRILLTLGCETTRKMTSVELAETADIPRQFALKIAQKLTVAGMIKAKRGVKGGLELARPPASITLFDVIRTVEEPRALNDCLLDPSSCQRAPYCAAHRGLLRIQGVLDEQLQNVTLAELINHQQEINKEAASQASLAAK